MDADAIRGAFLDYMTEQGHVIIPRAPLIPEDDPTTLFTGSGMQPLLPFLLGAEHPAGARLADSQTCLRVQDIEEVGAVLESLPGPGAHATTRVPATT